MGMVMAALVGAMVLLGCPTGTTEEPDTWTNITDLSQIDGTWKGSHDETMTIREIYESQGMWNNNMAMIFGGMKAAIRAEFTMTINANAKTRSASITMTNTFIGGNINTAWPLIKMYFQDLEGVTFNNADHSMTMVQNEPEQPLTEEEIAGMMSSDLQINQNGTKIKGTPDFNGLQREIIMTKQ